MKLLNKPLRLSARQITLGKSLLHLLILGWVIFTFYLGVTDNLGQTR